jgi:hypothetical protein
VNYNGGDKSAFETLGDKIKAPLIPIQLAYFQPGTYPHLPLHVILVFYVNHASKTYLVLLKQNQ